MEEGDKSGDFASAGLKRQHTGEESEAKRVLKSRRPSSATDGGGDGASSANDSDRGEGTGAGTSKSTASGRRRKRRGELSAAEDGDGAEERTDEEKKSSTETDEEETEDPAHQEAIEALTHIEVEFATLRDQIHSDHLARFDFELMLCSQGIHPELEAIEQRIRERRDSRTLWTQSALNYQLQCIATTTRAVREHLHQQFLKDRYDVRTELLQKTTREWYQVNDERRAADKLVPEYGLRDAAPQHVAMPRHQYPIAPEITGASEHELEGDLSQLR